jgi:hypothetical protein
MESHPTIHTSSVLRLYAMNARVLSSSSLGFSIGTVRAETGGRIRPVASGGLAVETACYSRTKRRMLSSSELSQRSDSLIL